MTDLLEVQFFELPPTGYFQSTEVLAGIYVDLDCIVQALHEVALSSDNLLPKRVLDELELLERNLHTCDGMGFLARKIVIWEVARQMHYFLIINKYGFVFNDLQLEVVGLKELGPEIQMLLH